MALPRPLNAFGTITVTSDPLISRIAVGEYDESNTGINQENFPDDPTAVGEWLWRLFDFERDISSEDAARAITACGWQPAKLDHLLALGAKYPREQLNYPITAVGSCSATRFPVVPLLCCTPSGKRSLDLQWWTASWPTFCRFLAVLRKT